MAVRKKIDTGKYSKFLIYLVVVVLLNIAGITLFFRLDLTSNKIYSLSEASRKVVSTLSEPLTIKVFFSSNLPAPYNNVERYLHDLLEEYAVAGGRYFNYQFYNVSGEESKNSEENQTLAKSYGVHPVQIQNIEQDEVKFQTAYMGIALIHGDIVEPIPMITSTGGLEYQITSTVRKMNNKISALLRLEDRISVKLVLSSSLKIVGPYMNISGLTSVPGKIEDIVNQLNDRNYGKLSFEYLDPTVNPDHEERARKHNVIRLNWDEFNDRRGRTISADKGYAGIVIEHGDNVESLELIEVIRLPIFGTQYQLADLSGLEDAINETVENVININEEIGYLSGHGTLAIGGAAPMFPGMQQQDSISNLNKLLSKEYSVKQVSLDDGGIPEGLSTMIIAGAKENFTDYELYQIDQFLMKGKSLAVFMDSFNEVTPQQGQQPMMNQFQRTFWMPLNTGLEKLLNNYGLNVKKSIVMDENSYKQRMPRQYGGGEKKIYFAPIIKNEMISKDAEYLENIKGLVLLKSSPVEINEQKISDSGLKAERLMSSSERSWEMAGKINLDPTFMRPPDNKDEFRSQPMAYVVEGSFPSYFADKPIPEKKGPEKAGEAAEKIEEEKEDGKEEGIEMSAIKSEGEILRKGKPAKIFLIGTSEILKDNVIDEGGTTPNAQFIMNVIDHLNGRGDIAVMRSKAQRFNPLQDIDPASRTAIKTINIAGLPVLVVIAGVAVWGRRSARKRMIQKIFSK